MVEIVCSKGAEKLQRLIEVSYNTIRGRDLPQHRTPYSTRNTLLTEEHPTHRGTPYSLRNTLLTAEHPTHRRTPYSPRKTLLTAEHPTHRGSHYSPPNSLLTVEHPIHRKIPYSLRNTLLNAEHPTYLGPAPRGKPYSLNRKILLKKSVCKSQHLIHGHCNL